MNIVALKDGPLFIQGVTLKIVHADGNEEIKSGPIALCRCGQSANKPFCDGSHREGFKGVPIELVLTDDIKST